MSTWFRRLPPTTTSSQRLVVGIDDAVHHALTRPCGGSGRSANHRPSWRRSTNLIGREVEVMRLLPVGCFASVQLPGSITLTVASSRSARRWVVVRLPATEAPRQTKKAQDGPSGMNWSARDVFRQKNLIRAAPPRAGRRVAQGLTSSGRSQPGLAPGRQAGEDADARSVQGLDGCRRQPPCA